MAISRSTHSLRPMVNWSQARIGTNLSQLVRLSLLTSSLSPVKCSQRSILPIATDAQMNKSVRTLQYFAKREVFWDDAQVSIDRQLVQVVKQFTPSHPLYKIKLPPDLEDKIVYYLQSGARVSNVVTDMVLSWELFPRIRGIHVIREYQNRSKEIENIRTINCRNTFMVDFFGWPPLEEEPQVAKKEGAKELNLQLLNKVIEYSKSKKPEILGDIEKLCREGASIETELFPLNTPYEAMGMSPLKFTLMNVSNVKIRQDLYNAFTF